VIPKAQAAGNPLRDGRSGQRLRTLFERVDQRELQTLAANLDEAEDAGWISQNAARGRRTREPRERRRIPARWTLTSYSTFSTPLGNWAQRVTGARRSSEVRYAPPS
jgi:hypothetical protein